MATGSRYAHHDPVGRPLTAGDSARHERGGAGSVGGVFEHRHARLHVHHQLVTLGRECDRRRLPPTCSRSGTRRRCAGECVGTGHRTGCLDLDTCTSPSAADLDIAHFDRHEVAIDGDQTEPVLDVVTPVPADVDLRREGPFGTNLQRLDGCGNWVEASERLLAPWLRLSPGRLHGGDDLRVDDLPGRVRGRSRLRADDAGHRRLGRCGAWQRRARQGRARSRRRWSTAP